ncbi:uncharacterized protein MONBRDRAFT_24275 [Monosiga brevicollis MX1]|uniref:Phosphodiesterase n=1 Tax=Monosiga brevicollis TaxID=81824 RepID=A9UVX6_MONBE|nr:uncharacterized protein MONBRDRAFT_24275 [Monosiga brevicollis MX1]EDQ90665.1 predicted protein [Monosiga brevicollis MX1]|eukprot:XP_001744716.1 hypothetical protein [Monosiga brevicollis MX1]
MAKLGAPDPLPQPGGSISITDVPSVPLSASPRKRLSYPDTSSDISTIKAEIDQLRAENRELRLRLDDFVRFGKDGLPASSEAMLLHQIARMARQPPFARTSRRKDILLEIHFPPGIIFSDNIDRPIAHIPDDFRARTKSFGFASLHMDPSELLLHWFVMFSELDLFARLNIQPACLREFFRQVHNAYRDNVYHNFQHAMDVAQFAYALYMHSDVLSKHFTHVDIFCCLVLGLGHDIDHPGVNNAFLIKTRDPVAILYNDTSVLENAHAATLFAMMRSQPTADLLASFDDANYTNTRSLILRGILATDMARHGTLVKKIAAAPSLSTQDSAPDAVKAVVLEAIAKCGDICHLVRPWPVAKAWEDLVMIEFFQQGDQEKALGFKPDGLFDRETCKVPNSQCWFYENIGKPLFSALAHHVPDVGNKLMSVMLEENLPHWKALC